MKTSHLLFFFLIGILIPYQMIMTLGDEIDEVPKPDVPVMVTSPPISDIGPGSNESHEILPPEISDGDDEFYKTISHTSPVWWDTVGRPYLKPEAGIFMSPKPNVYIPIATWTHLIELNLPCLHMTLAEEVPISWTNTLNSLTSILNTMLKDKTIISSRQSHEHLVYLLENQDNLIHMLDDIRNQIVRIDTVDQYIYGFLQKTCEVYDIKALKDAPILPVSTVEEFKELYRFDDSGPTPKPLDHQEVQDIAKKIFEGFHHDLTMKSQSAHVAWAAMREIELAREKELALRKEVSSPAPIISGGTGDEKTVDALNSTKPHVQGGTIISDLQAEPVRRKRELTDPTYYAQNVVNQYINRGNFTNINHLRDNPRLESSSSVTKMQQTESSRSTSFQSQMFEINSRKVKALNMPTITNYSNQSVSDSAEIPSTTPLTTTPMPYRINTPKERYAVNLNAMLRKASKPTADMNLTAIIPAIEDYYVSTLKDVDLISSRDPLEVELDQIGVLTIKLCYHYLGVNDEILTYCYDRYVPNVKRWAPICDGAAASDTLALQDSDMLSDSSYVRDDPQLLINKLGRYHFLNAEKVNSRLAANYTKHRTKRGLGDYLMKYGWKPMFGAVSEHDMKKMTRFMAQMKSSSATIHKNSKEMMSMIRATGDRLDAVSSSVMNITSVVYDVISATQTDLEKLHTDVAGLLKKGEATSVLAAVGSMQTYVQTSLTMLKFKLNDISSKYATLYDMVKKQYISPTILSATTLGDLMTDLELYNSSNWMIAPTWSSLATIDSRSASILAKGRVLLFTLKIPLVLKTNTYSTYMSHSVPIVLGKKIIEVVGGEHYYIMDSTNEQWTKLTESEYLLCSQSPGSICPLSFPTVPFKKPDCFISIIHGKDLALPNKICKMRILEDNKNFEFPDMGFISKPIGRNQWVVSILDPLGVTMYELCDSLDDGHAVQTATSKLKNVNVMSVTAGCRIQLGDMTFRAFDNWRTSTHQEYMFSDSLLINTKGLVQVKIWRMASVISETLENATIFSFEYDKNAKKTDYIFKKGLATLEDILKSTNLPALNYTQVGLEEPSLPLIPNFDVEEPTSWHISQWQIWSVILGSVPTIVFVGLIIYCILKYFVQSRTAAASVAFSALPTSFTRAEVTSTLAQNISNMLSTLESGRGLISNTSTQLTTMNISTGVTGGTSHVQQTAYMICMIMLMVVMLLMGLHHCYILYVNNKLVRKLMRSSRAYPWNKSITMYNVEEPLVMIFLIEISRLGSKIPTTTTLAIQVATLPSPYNQWVLKENRYVNITVSEAILTRRSKRLIIELNWTHMCILSTQHPNLDTCQEMPPTCVISKSGLETGIDGGLPWNWTQIKQKNVLKVEIGRLGACKTLYDYTDKDRGQYEDVTLASAPLLNKQ